MISRPLFIKVAESMVTFGPIDQLGCLRAASSVALAMSAFDHVRNGPPEAVIMTLVTSSRRPAVSAWNSALCSESTGSTVAPVRCARFMNSVPAQTRHSLLASASVAPRSIAASAGSRPAAPVIAPITQSAGRRPASVTASGPAAASMPLPESPAFRSPYAVWSATAAKRAPRSRASAASAVPFLCAVSATTAKRSRWRRSRSAVLDPIEPVAPRIVTVRAAGSGLERMFGVAINSPDQEAPRRSLEAPASQTHHGRRQYRCQKPVEPVHQPAMTRDQMARVLGVEPALDRGFQEIAGLRHDRQHQCDRRDGDGEL